MIETCARCGAQSAKIAVCEYCKRRICYTCVKSQKRKKPGKIFICKDDWSRLPSRRLFKAVRGS